jgi:phosphoglycerate dehydrogenase-like enzyme
MTQIACVTRLDDPEKIDRIKQVCPDARILHFHDDRDRLIHRGRDSEIVYGNVRPHELPALDRLRWVHANWTGIENLLYPAMVESDVIITNTRGQCAVPMAEHAVASLGYLGRDLPAHLQANQQGKWKRDDEPTLLAGSCVLLLGTGAIADQLIPRLRGLGMEVVGVNSDGRPIDGCRETYPLNVSALPLDQVDHVICLLPGTPATRGAIGHEMLGRLKPGATLINLSRGSVVDQQAMTHALETGQLRGAVLDVTDPEPLPDDHPLFNHPRVLITAHHSWRPPGSAGDLSLQTFIHNLQCFNENRLDQMRNVVDKQRGY